MKLLGVLLFLPWVVEVSTLPVRTCDLVNTPHGVDTECVSESVTYSVKHKDGDSFPCHFEACQDIADSFNVAHERRLEKATEELRGIQ